MTAGRRQRLMQRIALIPPLTLPAE